MFKKKKENPLMYVVGSYLLISFVVALILKFPLFLTGNGDVSFLDSSFMAVSSIATTGLTTVDYVNDYNYLGWLVYIIVFNIGGVGIIVANTVLLLAMGKKIGYRNRLLAKYDYNKLDSKDMVTITKSVIKFFLLFETIGTVLIFLCLGRYYDDIIERFMNSLFLSASGVSGSGFYNTTTYGDNLPLLIVIMALMIFSFIGYPVVLDLKNKVKKRLSKEKYKLTDFSKITLKVNLITVALFAVILIVLEKDNTFVDLTFGEQIVHSIYMSISTKSIGLSLFTDFTNFKSLTLLFFIIFMIIGGAPSSACGGVKVMSVYVIVKHLGSFFHKSGKAFVGNYMIKEDTILKSYFLVFMFIIIIFISSLVIFAINNNIDSFINVTFDVTSGFTTTGFTTGALAKMNNLSITILTALMLIGRVGIINIVGAINLTTGGEMQHVEYLEKDLPI